MNKIKQWLWVRPNEYFNIYWPHINILIDISVVLIILDCIFNFNSPTLDFITINGAMLGIYRLMWKWASREEGYSEDKESSYDFTPTFFKSTTREHLYSALESAKISRQLAAAQENNEEFEHWEVVIMDIENLIENYSE